MTKNYLLLYAPNYYKKFMCIADKCKHSCCVGWEIDIDSDTVDKYHKLTSGYGSNINNSISYDGLPHFKLCENDRCPHLNGNGLCNIILNLGEEYLCDICREHPRFYNNTVHGKEVGLGLSCEEACRIILSSDEYNEFYILEELEGDVINLDFDAVRERNRTYGIISDRSVDYTERLMRICRIYDIDLLNVSNKEWVELISDLEYLNEAHKELFLSFSSDLNTPAELEKYCERFFAYAVYRHCSGAVSKEDYRAALFMALFFERLFVSVIIRSNVFDFEHVTDIARIISEEIEYSEDNTDTIKYSFL